MDLNDKLYGLVLTGGQSSRMGVDKSRIQYHGIPQMDYLISLLNEVCDDVFLSVQTKQDGIAQKSTNTILDKNLYLGPFNGIYSAHLVYPDAAWLVLACDLPFIDLDALQDLKNNRNKQKQATAYCKNSSGFPEPLCAIWESDSFQHAEKYFKKGEGASPSKFLKAIDVHCVYPKNDELLVNANTFEEYQLAKKRIDSNDNES